MEKVNLDPYLKEALLSQQNRTTIALLLFDQDRADLMPTQLEDIFFHAQGIIDKYCVCEDERG
jgi:hypothetical protein